MSAPHAGTPVRPVVLIVLDGWGLGRDEPGNAVLRADTPVMDALWATYPHTTLKTSGEDVGLPAGQMGNSEVGHLNLGAGFVVYQWLTRIDKAIADGDFVANPVLLGAMSHVRREQGTLHLIGLASDGGVHSHLRHLEALLRLARDAGVPRVAIHVITDGRDTAPNSGAGFIEQINQMTATIGVGEIASVSGRYFAMDRDHRWERTRAAYDAIVHGIGQQAPSAAAAVAAAYAAGVTDEFLPPTAIVPSGESPGQIRPGDGIIFFNFRSDRGRQLTAALADPSFTGWDRGERLANAPVVTLTTYDPDLPVAVAFAPHDVVTPLARVISEAGLTQFHAAETEKYAHVTFFFNGGREEPFAGEVRTLVPSPKVATYDLQPEMSAPALTDAVVTAIQTGQFAFVLVNFANGDMVGHTGVLAAARRAVETVDRCLGRVVDTVLTASGAVIVTADHGNAEEMIDAVTGGPLTAHTTNPVPLVLVAPPTSPWLQTRLRDDGCLAAVAPTVLELLGVPTPPAMTEPSLFARTPDAPTLEPRA